MLLSCCQDQTDCAVSQWGHGGPWGLPLGWRRAAEMQAGHAPADGLRL